MLWECWHVCPDGVLTKIMAEYFHFKMRGLMRNHLTGRVRISVPETEPPHD